MLVGIMHDTDACKTATKASTTKASPLICSTLIHESTLPIRGVHIRRACESHGVLATAVHQGADEAVCTCNGMIELLVTEAYWFAITLPTKRTPKRISELIPHWPFTFMINNARYSSKSFRPPTFSRRRHHSLIRRAVAAWALLDKWFIVLKSCSSLLLFALNLSKLRHEKCDNLPLPHQTHTVI